MHIVITGATGFLGSALTHKLLSDGHEVSALVRSRVKCKTLFAGRVQSFTSWHEAPESADAVINLAGEPLVGARWTAAKKDRIRSSRLTITQGINTWVSRMQLRPDVLISGSAIGYYGYSDLQEFTESHEPGSDFGARLCAEWEKTAFEAKVAGIRVCTIRTGVVLHPSGGALKHMLPAYRFGLGGPMGKGSQHFSWIHLSDWINAVRFLLRSDHLQGAFNLTSPNVVQNAAFSSALAKQLSRPNVLRMPSFAMRALFGEGADLLLKGQAVQPAKLLEQGFVFEHAELVEALQDLLP